MREYTEVKDSGRRQEFTTGSVRDTREGKGRYDLVSPLSMRRLARHFEAGAKKYGENNWTKGQPVTRYIDSALRHIFNFIEGMRDEDHMTAAAWNCLAAVHTLEAIERGLLPAELNDLPDYMPATPASNPVDRVMEDELPEKWIES